MDSATHEPGGVNLKTAVDRGEAPSLMSPIPNTTPHRIDVGPAVLSATSPHGLISPRFGSQFGRLPTLSHDLTQPGQAHLRCHQVAGQSAVTTAFATSPLKLLTPRPRGKSVWACLASFGGGLLAGDETSLDIELGHDARCFLGTQASTKIYRNPARRPCSFRLRANVNEDAILVLAPDAVQCFAGSSFNQRQEILLHPSAGLVLLDWCSSGRVARGERWAFNRYSSRIEISDPTPKRLFLDSLVLDPEHGAVDSPMRLGRFNCMALLLFLGPALRAHAQALRREFKDRPVARRNALVFSASRIRDGALLRVAGESFEHVAREIRACLAFLPELLGDDPFERKW